METTTLPLTLERQAIVDSVGDLARALDPSALSTEALIAVLKLHGLFVVLVDAEMADCLAGEPGPAVVDAEWAIVAAAPVLLATVDGAGLPDRHQNLVGAVRDRIRPAA